MQLLDVDGFPSMRDSNTDFSTSQTP